MSGYRKFVGKLLYGVTKVLPDCANAVRDLTCHLFESRSRILESARATGWSFEALLSTDEAESPEGTSYSDRIRHGLGN